MKKKKEGEEEEKSENKGCSSLIKKNSKTRDSCLEGYKSVKRILTNEEFEKYVTKFREEIRMKAKKSKNLRNDIIEEK